MHFQSYIKETPDATCSNKIPSLNRWATGNIYFEQHDVVEMADYDIPQTNIRTQVTELILRVYEVDTFGVKH